MPKLIKTPPFSEVPWEQWQKLVALIGHFHYPRRVQHAIECMLIASTRATLSPHLNVNPLDTIGQKNESALSYSNQPRPRRQGNVLCLEAQ